MRLGLSLSPSSFGTFDFRPDTPIPPQDGIQRARLMFPHLWVSDETYEQLLN